MEKENTNPTKEKEVTPSVGLSYNELRINGITLISNDLTMDNLSGYLLWLLQQPEIREYLDIVKQTEKLNGSYLG